MQITKAPAPEKAAPKRAEQDLVDFLKKYQQEKQISVLAVKLHELDSENRSLEEFKKKFAFAFELLVDAELQLRDLPRKLKNVTVKNPPRTNRG